MNSNATNEKLIPLNQFSPLGFRNTVAFFKKKYFEFFN